ncbi:MAG: hypothetical protein HXS44_08220 [Theionarchaea archaeon]|nr:hypothetical protein [Theionarchaea archaeon]
MTRTNSTFKLTLLKYGGILSISGIIVIILCILALKVFSSLFEDKSSLIITAAATIIFGTIFLYIGSACINLQKVVKELSSPFTVEDADFIHNTITITDERSRLYKIKYTTKELGGKSFIEWFYNSPDTRDETGYYEAWTPIKRSPEKGSLPWFAKVIKKDGTAMLQTILSRKTATSQLNERLTSLGNIAHDIDLYGYGENP